MHYLNDMTLELDDGAQVKETTDGYLTAVPRVARTGIQLYRGSELGVKDKAIVRIFRDEAEVFNKDSLASFAGKPYTDNHPPVMVNAKNWRKYSAGDAGDEILRDGEYVRVPMMLRDAATISKVKKGKVQLSVGYGCEIDWTPGTTPTGEAYDGRQTGIRVNHIAVVDAARGGDKLSIGDGQEVEVNHPLYKDDGSAFVDDVQPQKDTRDMKTLIVDGITCEMSDTAVEVVRRALDKAVTDAAAVAKKFGESEADYQKRIKAADEAVAKLTTEGATKDAEIVTLKSQLKDSELTPAKLDALVKDRSIVADKAKALLPTVVVDGKSVGEIMKQVVDAKIGDAAKDWKEDMIKVSFDTLTVGVQAVNDGISRTVHAFSGQPQSYSVGDGAAKEAMYDKRDKSLENAWKGASGQA
jgi:hypothetical protein